jgi:hypothetical protein
MQMSDKPADQRQDPTIIQLRECCDEIEKFFAELRMKYGNAAVNRAKVLSDNRRP